MDKAEVVMPAEAVFELRQHIQAQTTRTVRERCAVDGTYRPPLPLGVLGSNFDDQLVGFCSQTGRLDVGELFPETRQRILVNSQQTEFDLGLYPPQISNVEVLP